MERKRLQKIGIMGGTFNPIHNGHLIIAENAREEFQLDQILFIPTGHSPHKKERQIADASLRCDMISLAIKDNPFFQQDLTEVSSADISYTYITLQKLKKIYPVAQLYFILGADSLFDIESWKNPEQILSICSILAAYRQHERQTEFSQQIAYLKEKYNCCIYPLDAPKFDVSSSEIRNRIEKNKTIRYMVPKEVEDYIKKNQLYLNQNERSDLSETQGN